MRISAQDARWYERWQKRDERDRPRAKRIGAALVARDLRRLGYEEISTSPHPHHGMVTYWRPAMKGRA